MNISVLLPTYNAEKTISKAIKSILSQTFRNYELLIIDDGSTDKTEEVVNLFGDNRIKYIKKEHSGLADTLNYGLEIAKYDWVARMDADDISHPHRFQKQISIINKNDNFISSTWSIYFYNSKFCFSTETPTDIIIFKKKLALHCIINHASVIYNRKFILSKGGYNKNINIYEDYELWLRIIDDIDVEVVPEYLYFIRFSPQSISMKNYNIEKKTILKMQKLYYPLDNKKSHFNENEIIEILGWREYFYGSPKKARKFWLKWKLPFLFTKPRVLVAFFITFFPSRIFNQILYQRLKLRFSFLLTKMQKNKLIKGYEKFLTGQ